jgi:hypothetical protein
MYFDIIYQDKKQGPPIPISHFPMAPKSCEGIILHPNEIWGHNEGCLYIGVIN